MALETGTYISDLTVTNPTSGDPVSQADDHLRLLKSTLKATFPNVSGAVTPTHTELNYVVGVTSLIQTQLDQAKLTTQAFKAASGTTVDFTSIPSWVKRITLIWSGVSTNGTSIPIVQLGSSSGGIETTVYSGSSCSMTSPNLVGGATATTGFAVNSADASAGITGIMTICLLTGNSWVASGAFSYTTGATSIISTGTKSLSSTLDRVRVTTTNGTDSYDGGTLNVLYD